MHTPPLVITTSSNLVPDFFCVKISASIPPTSKGGNRKQSFVPRTGDARGIEIRLQPRSRGSFSLKLTPIHCPPAPYSQIIDFYRSSFDAEAVTKATAKGEKIGRAS